MPMPNVQSMWKKHPFFPASIRLHRGIFLRHLPGLTWIIYVYAMCQLHNLLGLNFTHIETNLSTGPGLIISSLTFISKHYKHVSSLIFKPSAPFIRCLVRSSQKALLGLWIPFPWNRDVICSLWIDPCLFWLRCHLQRCSLQVVIKSLGDKSVLHPNDVAHSWQKGRTCHGVARGALFALDK